MYASRISNRLSKRIVSLISDLKRQQIQHQFPVHHMF